MRVLLVDDSRTIQATLTEVITSFGHEVVSATNGTAGLAEIYKQPPDLIFMDVEMPGLNGFETTKAIRTYLQDIWIPIIFLSSQRDESYIVEGLDAGGDAYITKPVNFKVLEAMVRAMGRISLIQEELHATNLTLQKQANIDALTQTMNRRGFDDSLEKELNRCKRRRLPLSLVIVDIDHFKLFNDNYGHVKGDEVLRKVGKTLIACCKRPGDIAARYGGEEFAMILPDTNSAGAENVAQQLKVALEKLAIEHKHSTNSDILTVSQGVATLADYDEPIDLVDCADNALYQAKRSGRNRWQVYDQQNR